MAKRIKIPKETKKEKIHLFDYYDVLGMGSMSSARIEFFSNEKVIVEKCRCVSEYTDTLIRLNLGEKNAILMGENLKINSLEGKNIVITGVVNTLEFTE